MAMTKKVIPKDTKLKVGGENNYKSSTIKGKGNSKMQDVKACNKKMKK